MKEKLKKEKGITLIALVITIIIMLILAMVSISIIKNQGIITKSNEAVEKYSQAEKDEQENLTEMEKKIDQYSNNKWWEMTEKEKEELSRNASSGDRVYTVANNGIKGSTQGGKEIELYLDGAITIGFDNKEVYVYTFSEEKVHEWSTGWKTKLDINKWYYGIINEDKTSITVVEYKGTAPIKEEDFTEIYSESYLQRIINSFNN